MSAPPVILEAAQRFLDQTEGLDPPTSEADMVLLAAAWLDFYDDTWAVLAEIYDLPRFDDPSARRPADLQRDLRALADRLDPKE